MAAFYCTLNTQYRIVSYYIPFKYNYLLHNVEMCIFFRDTVYCCRTGRLLVRHAQHNCGKGTRGSRPGGTAVKERH